MPRATGGDEAAAERAMRAVLYKGIIELRAMAFRTRKAIAEGDEPFYSGGTPLFEMNMVADTLHHIPLYMFGEKLDGRRDLSYLSPPWNRRQPAVTWFASLWQVRSRAQEVWLLSVLNGANLTPSQILGARILEVVEDNRRRMQTRMSRSEAEALADRVQRESEYVAKVGERDGDFYVTVIGTPAGMVPLWDESAWDHHKRALKSRRRK